MFICTNQKSNGKPCCATHNSCEIVEYAKARSKELGLTKELKFRISSSGCLGRCSSGPVLVVYPDGVWHTYNSKEDIDKILIELADKCSV